MSQILANIKKQQAELTNQRLQVKDVLDNIEKNLAEVNNILGVLDAVEKERKASEAEPTEAKSTD